MRKAIGVILGAGILSVATAAKCDDGQCQYQYNPNTIKRRTGNHGQEDVCAQNEIDNIQKNNISGKGAFDGEIHAADEIDKVYVFRDTEEYCPKKKATVQKCDCEKKSDDNIKIPNYEVSDNKEECDDEGNKRFTFDKDQFGNDFDKNDKSWEKDCDEHKETKVRGDNKREGGYFKRSNNKEIDNHFAAEDKEDCGCNDEKSGRTTKRQRSTSGRKNYGGQGVAKVETGRSVGFGSESEHNVFARDNGSDRQSTSGNDFNEFSSLNTSSNNDSTISTSSDNGDFFGERRNNNSNNNNYENNQKVQKVAKKNTNYKTSNDNSTSVAVNDKRQQDSFDLKIDNNSENNARDVSKVDERDTAVNANNNYARAVRDERNNKKNVTDKETTNETAEEQNTVSKNTNVKAAVAHKANNDSKFDLSKDNSKRHHCEFNEQKHQCAGIRQGLISEECVELKEHVHAHKQCKSEKVEKKRWLKKKCHKKSFREKHGLNKHAKCIKNKAAHCDKFGVLKKHADCKKRQNAADECNQVKVCKRVCKNKATTDNESTDLAANEERVDNATFAEAQQQRANSLRQEKTLDNKSKTKKQVDADSNSVDEDKRVAVRNNNKNNVEGDEDCGCDDDDTNYGQGKH